MVENVVGFEEFEECVCRNNEKDVELHIRNKTWVSFEVNSIKMIVIDGIECYNLDYKKYSSKV